MSLLARGLSSAGISLLEAVVQQAEAQIVVANGPWGTPFPVNRTWTQAGRMLLLGQAPPGEERSRKGGSGRASLLSDALEQPSRFLCAPSRAGKQAEEQLGRQLRTDREAEVGFNAHRSNSELLDINIKKKKNFGKKKET